MEDGDSYKVRNNVPLTIDNGEMYSEMCRLYCKKITEAGISYCGVYASKNILENILSISDLNIWVAQWNDTCTYNGKYDFWQYSSRGLVDGISSNVDLDYCYKKFDVFTQNSQNDNNLLEDNNFKNDKLDSYINDTEDK